MALDTNALIRASRCIDSCLPDGMKLAGIIEQLDELKTELGSLTVTVSGITDAATVITTSIVTNPNTAVPIVLGLATVTFKRVVFYGRNAARVDNMGNVWIQFDAADGAAGLKLGPGETEVIEAPEGRVLNAAQFWIDVETGADGVLAIFYS